MVLNLTNLASPQSASLCEPQIFAQSQKQYHITHHSLLRNSGAEYELRINDSIKEQIMMIFTQNENIIMTIYHTCHIDTIKCNVLFCVDVERDRESFKELPRDIFVNFFEKFETTDLL